MDYVGETVYTVNAKTNSIDEWECFGEINGIYRGKGERLCMLEHDGKQAVLPKRCVFTSREKALKISKL